jgi:hypothetical protein
MTTSITDLVKEQYPDFTIDQVRELALRTMSWMSLLGSTAVNKIEAAEGSQFKEIEERAQIIAFNAVANVISMKYVEHEEDKLKSIIDYLLSNMVKDTIPGTGPVKTAQIESVAK